MAKFVLFHALHAVFNSVIVTLIGLLFVNFTTADAQEVYPDQKNNLFSNSSLKEELSSLAALSKIDGVAVTILDPSGKIHTAYVGDDVDSHALFQAASMSKSVTALATLILAHKKDIKLDEDIRPYLTSLDWKKIRGGGDPVTLRQLLSHTAGSTLSGFPGYKKSESLPSSIEIVTGGRGVNTSAVKLNGKKGRFKYSGGGYQILQIFVEDLTGKPFEIAMKEIVLDPLGMHKSTFEQPLVSENISPLTIVSADAGFNPMHGIFLPIKNDWRNYPEKAAAGLWTTSEDFMKFAIALLFVELGEDVLGIPNSALKMMMTEVDKNYGLGLILKQDPDGNIVHFGHTGGNAGYRCIFRIYPQTGLGIVALTNNPNGVQLMKRLVSDLEN